MHICEMKTNYATTFNIFPINKLQERERTLNWNKAAQAMNCLLSFQAFFFFLLFCKTSYHETTDTNKETNP